MPIRPLLGLILVCTVTAHAAAPAARPYDVTHYRVMMQVDPSKNPQTFKAITEVQFQATARIDKVVFDAEELDIDKAVQVQPDSRPVRFKLADDKRSVEVKLTRAMKKGETWTVGFEYTGRIRDSHDGLFRVTDPEDPAKGTILSTMFETQGARKFMPCNDRPDDKATVEVEATVPTGYTVISNGRKMSDRPSRGGGHRVLWKMEKPHSTYLISLAIGKFGSVRARANRVPVSVWTSPAKTKLARHALDSTVASVKFFESYLGVKYPWRKYAIVSIPTFLWGGMENTSATHQNERRTLLHDADSELEKSTIVELGAHELAHQWFGDAVTMEWWEDVWLNEAFASYAATEATKHFFKNDQAEVDSVLAAWESYFRQEDGPRSHPIVDKGMTSPDGYFDDISYTKGEQVLRMLKFWIGEPAFRKGLKNYLTAYKYKNATYVDFFQAMEKASGKKMAAFRDSWLLHRGYPVLHYTTSWDAAAKTSKLHLEQHANHVEDKTVFQFALPVAFHRKTAPAYDKTVVIPMTGAAVDEKVVLPAEPEWVTVNPGSPVLARIQPEDRNEDRLSLQARQDPDTLGRLWAAYELARGLKEGQSISEKAQQTLAEVIASDPSPYARIALLRTLRSAKTRWLPEPVANAVLAQAKATFAPEYEKSPLYTADTHGARLYRATLVGALGKVEDGEAGKFLAGLLGRPGLGLDELTNAALAVAQIGDEKTDAVLKEALKKHGARGYAYAYAVQYAYGAYESPKAAARIAEFVTAGGTDLLGRIGGVVRDNQTLKSSPEWAQFVQTFVVGDTRFGDEVKARILRTIEEVKSDAVKNALQAIQKDAKSPRMQEDSRRILDKNFSHQS